ncbi:MAG: signal peptidase I [Clostridia bacterium]|nr:signal peptidase I [Clostridia bacterium]
MLFRKNKNKNNSDADADIEAVSEQSASADGQEGRSSAYQELSAIFGPDNYGSDWKPFVQYIDEEDSSDDVEKIRSEAVFYEESEEAGFESDEEKNKDEQYAFFGEDADSIGEGEARYDDGACEASQGYKDAEGNGLFESGRDAGDGGREKEIADGAGENREDSREDSGEENAETEESINYEPVDKSEDDDFDSDGGPFGHDEDIELIGSDSLGWNRKQLILSAEKKGLKVIADDDILTAVESGYIDREAFLAKKNVAAQPVADISDEELISAEKKKHEETFHSENRIPEHMIGPLKELGILNSSYDAGLLSDESDVQEEKPYAVDPATASFSDSIDFENIGALKETVPEAVSDYSGSENAYYDDVFEDDPGVLRKRSIRNKVFSVVKEIIKDVLIFFIVFAVIIMGYLTYSVYISRSNHVYGTSMEPTLHPDDKVKSSLMPYVFGKPKTGDIVIIDVDRIGRGFSYFERVADVLKTNDWISEKFFGGQEEDTLFIKRVVAVGGDTIEFKDDKFYRNGELVVEPYLNEQDVYNYPNGTTLTIPEGYIFVMGDNRNVSYDSRNSDIGMIPIYAITGKVN